MKRLLFLSCFSFLFGDSLKYALHNSHAFPFVKNKTLITLEYQKLNDTIDVLNIKDQELGDSISDYASIGDMDGYKVNITYGFSEKITLNACVNVQNIEYGSGKLKNKKYEIFGRYNFFQNPFSKLAASIDIGGITNQGNDIVYDDINLLNNLGHKISSDFKLVESNGKYYIIKPATGEYLLLTQKPYISIENLEDFTFYGKINIEKKFSNHFFLNGFIKLNTTSIKTHITANPELVKKAKDYGYDLDLNLDRSETSVNIGFNVTYGINYIWEFEYYYTKIFRDKDLDYIDYNHVVNLDVIKPLNKNWFIYAGGKVMYRQFNGEIPYLYNKYSQTTFDHKYGYARAGVGFVF